MKTAKNKTNKNIIKEKYTKNQIINSKTFVDNRDLLNVILKEGKSYTKEEIYEEIKNYKKGKVK